MYFLVQKSSLVWKFVNYLFHKKIKEFGLVSEVYCLRKKLALSRKVLNYHSIMKKQELVLVLETHYLPYQEWKTEQFGACYSAMLEKSWAL